MLAHLFRTRRTSGRPVNPRPACRPWRPLLEALEDRCVPAVYNVNTLQDLSIAAGVNPATGTINGTPGLVTLRSAIQASNNTPGSNTINLTLPGDYRIALPGSLEDNNQTGDFDIIPTAVAAPVTGNTLQILNTSGGSVVVDGAGLDRVFDINPGNTNNLATKLSVVMQGFTIENGVAADAGNPDGPAASGGGIRDQGNTNLTLNNMVVTNNSATADGGGISMENAPVSTPWVLALNNSTVSNNRAGDAGGGIDTDGTGSVFLNSSTVTGNTCVNQGAGIWLDAIGAGSANLTVSQSLVSSNLAINGPTGGIGNAGSGAVTIDRSTVAYNFCGGSGGGFGDENNLGTLTVLNSTFVGNSSTGNGGGIQEGGPSTAINDSTITGNTTLTEGGGLAVTSPAFVLNNTIVAGNLANAGGMNFLGVNPDILAPGPTGSGNFIGIGTGLTGITNGTNGNQIGTAAAPLNPLLGPLQNNGGPTPTEAPLPGSPVIDKGVNGVLPAGTTTDQRGLPRIANGTVDVGAVESQTIQTTLTLTASTTLARPGQTVTFTATVAAPPGFNFPTPQGSVTFIVNGLAMTAPLVNGTATLPVNFVTPGPHTVTATYNGDSLAGFGTSTASVTVTQLPTLTATIFRRKGRFIVQIFLNGTRINQLMLPKGVSRVQQTLVDVNNDGIPDLVISFVQNKKKRQIVFNGINGQRV